MILSIPYFLLLLIASASPLRSYAFSTPAGPTSSSSSLSSPSYSRRAVRPTCDARRGGSSYEGRRRRRYREVDCGPGIIGAEGGSRALSAPMPSRRRAVAAAAAAVFNVHNMLLSADAAPIPSSSTRPATEGGKVYVRGRATLQSPDLFDDVLAAGRTANNDNGAALYVTARPSRPDSVPAAVLDGSRGRPPPVLSARYPRPDFPFDFELTSFDLTPEGAAASATTPTTMDDGRDGVWWAGEDLVVSARLDTDGVASTRDPTDLVGRGIFRPPAATPASTAAASAAAAAPATVVSIELRGRGMFGKSVTGRK